MNRYYEPEWFEVDEFVPSEVIEVLGREQALLVMDYRILKTADTIRNHFNARVTINNYKWGGPLRYRGFRPAKCKTGAIYSQHRFGRAIDCDIDGVSAVAARKEIIKEAKHFPYITALENGVPWLHVDCRAIRGEILLFNS